MLILCIILFVDDKLVLLRFIFLFFDNAARFWRGRIVTNRHRNIDHSINRFVRMRDHMHRYNFAKLAYRSSGSIYCCLYCTDITGD